METKISVVTVTYNAEKEIAKTLESICRQTYKNIELVIKDGKSMDQTNSLIKQMNRKYSERTFVHIISADDGIYSAMNEAVEHCTGDWVIFLNAGDYFAGSSVLQDIFSKKDYSKVDVLYGDATIVDRPQRSIWVGNLKDIPNKMPFCHQTCFTRRELLMKNKFDESYRIAADYNLIYSLYDQKRKFQYLEKVVSIFNLDGISSTKYFLRVKEQHRVIKSHGNKIRWRRYLLQYADAAGKAFINKCIPLKYQNGLRIFYARNIKKYKKIES